MRSQIRQTNTFEYLLWIQQADHITFTDTAKSSSVYQGQAKKEVWQSEKNCRYFYHTFANVYYDGNWVEVNQYFKSSETVVTLCVTWQSTNTLMRVGWHVAAKLLIVSRMSKVVYHVHRVKVKAQHRNYLKDFCLKCLVIPCLIYHREDSFFRPSYLSFKVSKYLKIFFF